MNYILYIKAFFLARIYKVPIILRVETNFSQKINEKIIKVFSFHPLIIKTFSKKKKKYLKH